MKLLNGLINKMKEGGMRLYGAYCGIMSAFLVSYCNVYADGSGTDKIDKFIQFAKDWLIKIGGIVAMVGGVMVALSWQRDDAEGKSKALMTIMAGLMLVAVAETSKAIFGA